MSIGGLSITSYQADGKDRLYTWEGLSKESRAKLREYLDTEIEAGWTRSDVLLILGLYHGQR